MSTQRSQRSSSLCPRCHRLVSAHESICPHCGLSAPTSFWRRLSLISWLSVNNRLVVSIIGTNLFLFIFSLMLASPSFSSSPFSFLAPAPGALLALGASGTIPIQKFHVWYSLISANWLHGSLLHLGFNMAVLYQLIRPALHFYGTARTLLIYIFGGILGFGVSYLAGIPFTVGASAAVCALIGALMYYGKSRGGIHGQTIYKQLGIWAIFILISGFVVSGINNWAHLGGFVAGIGIGFLLGYHENRPEKGWMRKLAGFMLFLTVAILIFCIYNSLLIRFFLSF